MCEVQLLSTKLKQNPLIEVLISSNLPLFEQWQCLNGKPAWAVNFLKNIENHKKCSQLDFEKIYLFL